MPLAVAVVGRPNVGKSTLFNRLAGKQLAIVHDTPGVTRDRQDALAQLGSLSVRLIDTAGFDIGAPGSLSMRMTDQTLAAIKEADVCLFVVNARDGVTTGDEIIADALRRSGKPTLAADSPLLPGAATEPTRNQTSGDRRAEERNEGIHDKPDN